MSEDPPRHNLFAIDQPLAFSDAAVAILTLEDGRYLMQLRDDKPDIFYPDHWGLFGGGIDAGEDSQTCLRRELMEELTLAPRSLTFFTRMVFDFSPFGCGTLFRDFFLVPLTYAELSRLTLGEGRKMEAVDLQTLLIDGRVVPYDSFALWMHYAASRRRIQQR